jgi:hypothetical protein
MVCFFGNSSCRRATAGEGKGEEGAITNSDQTIGAGGEHRFQRILRERGFACRMRSHLS